MPLWGTSAYHLSLLAVARACVQSCVHGRMRRAFTPEEMPGITSKAEAVVKEKQAFERIVLTKEEALRMFADNPFKVQLISTKIPDGGYTTAYRCGPLIDLCRGPHVPTTGAIKAFEALRASSSYWLGSTDNDSLQRVYGISFPDAKQLRQYKTMVEEAKKRDHRVLGTKQELFFFHDLSPGCCFFLPHGARVYNKVGTCAAVAATAATAHSHTRASPFTAADGPHPRRVPQARLHGGHHPQHVQHRPLAHQWPRGSLPGQHVHV